MQKKTVYLAGKITGDPFYRSKFYEAQKKLEKPDWKESKGAKYEFGEAIAQNKPFFFFEDWEREGSQNAEK